MLLAASILAVAVAVCAPAPDASDAHFAIVNDDDTYFPNYGGNFGTVMKLLGPHNNASLNVAATLGSGAERETSTLGTPDVQVVRNGADICIFTTDGVDMNGANHVSSFKYPSLLPVGTYTDSNVPTSLLPYWLVSSGGYVFVGFVGYISSWEIQSGCALSLLQTTATNMHLAYKVAAATPNGRSIIASGGYSSSFLIGPNGGLTEVGPYLVGAENQMDITADSQYAIWGAGACNSFCFTAVITVQINPDGSLDPESEQQFGGDGSLGPSPALYYVRLSPDEHFLYGTGSTQDSYVSQVTTLGFTENPLGFTYHKGCTTVLNIPEFGFFAYDLRTASPTGSGGALYIAEERWIGLLGINPTTGCTKEAPGSPFSLNDPNSDAYSVAAWPMRPF